MTKLTILLPAHNEEKAIGSLLDEIQREIKNLDYQILVAENASTDSTLLTALDRGARVLPCLTKGKGNAIREAISRLDTPYTIMMNSDLTYPPAYVKLLYAELLKGADVVMGHRSTIDTGAMSTLHALGNWSLSLLASILYRYRVTDLCTGMWGFYTPALQKFKLVSPGFTLEADLFTNAIKSKCKISQVPIAYRARLEGDRPKLQVRDGLEIARFLIARRMRSETQSE